jgi:hypothetical protein
MNNEEHDISMAPVTSTSLGGALQTEPITLETCAGWMHIEMGSEYTTAVAVAMASASASKNQRGTRNSNNARINGYTYIRYVNDWCPFFAWMWFPLT